MEERLTKHEIGFQSRDSDEDEDTRSVRSSHTTKSSCSKSRMNTESLREKLMEQNSYSTEATHEIVSKCGKGLDINAAQKNAKSAIENIQAIDVILPIASGKEKISELQTGQTLMDFVTNMIIQGGEVLVAVVKSNFNLDHFVDEVRETIRDTDDLVNSLETSIVEVEVPDKVLMDLELKVEIEDHAATLLDDLKLKFEKRRRRVVKKVSKSSDEDGSDNIDQAFESWQGSPEEQQYHEECAAFKVRATSSMERQYVAESKKAKAARRANQETTQQITALKLKISRCQVTALMASELQKQANHIVQKIKNAISDNTLLQTKLKQNVIVNGDAVHRPLITDNLSGIYQILYNEYNKVSISFLCDFLLRLLSVSMTADEADSNPAALVTTIAPMIKQWHDMQLDKHLTADMLFVVALLKGYPSNSKARVESLQVVLREAQARETDPHRTSRAEAYPGMAMYSELVNFINEILAKSKQFGPTAVDKPKDTKVRYAAEKSSVLETAAVAVTERSVSSCPSSRQYVTGTYRSEITRDQNLYVKNQFDNSFIYTATKQPCSMCQHVPRCYNHHCPKCKLYGHKVQQCHQHPPKFKGGGAGSA